MTVAALDLIPYVLPLAEPVVWAGEPHRQRRGVLVRLADAEGRVGWGDAAPLPGFSRETLDDARAALDETAPVLVGRTLDALEVVADGPFHRALDAVGLPPSARFGLDLALADLASQELGRTLPQALHPDPAVVLPLNGLILGGDAPARARALAQAGYRAVKLKVGRGPVEADVETAHEVREALPDGVALRLDANRAWSWDQALAFAEGVAGLALDYVEEPLAEPERLPELWHDTGLAVAVDESVQEGAPIRGWASAAVLKPTLVGGVVATLRRAAEARAVGVRPVLSASFESGVGLRGVAALAAATGAAPAGLDTYRWLAADVLANAVPAGVAGAAPATRDGRLPLPLDRPQVDVPALFAHPVAVRLP